MQNLTLFQFFHWYYNAEGNLWQHASDESARLADLGVTHVWLPPAYKSALGTEEPGYAVYDLYDLGEFDPSIWGMIKKFPQAVVVTLFRPFPWEARKLIIMLSALEALAFVYFTIKAFTKAGFLRTIKLINKDPNLLFFLIFSLIFAFAVGISSYNFGALARYKIPCLPFYAALIMILTYHNKLTPQYKKKSIRSKKLQNV